MAEVLTSDDDGDVSSEYFTDEGNTEDEDEEIEADVAAEADEEVAKWRTITTKKPSEVRIRFSPMQDEHLKTALLEWQDVFEGVLRKGDAMGIDRGALQRGDLDATLQYFLSDIIGHLLGHVNAVHHREGKPVCKRSNILGFIHIELMCATQSESPTNIYKVDPVEAQNACEKDLYFSILRALSQPFDANHVPYQLEENIKELEKIINDVCKPCFSKKHSIISLDDDKVPTHGRDCAIYGMAAKKIKKNFGPVNHIVASVLTSMMIAVRGERLHSTVASNIKVLLQTITGEFEFDDIKLPDTLITKDRGYNFQSISDLLFATGAHELGTRKRERNFPFTFDQKPSRKQREIPTSGHRCGYFGTYNPNIPGRPNTRIHGIAFRDNGRVVLATTSRPDCGVHQFHAVPFRTPAPETLFQIADLPEDTINSETLLGLAEEQVVLLTQSQRDAAWFLMRMFRITSSVSAKFVSQWIRTVDDTSVIPGLDILTNVIGYRTSGQSQGHDQINRIKLTFTVAQLKGFCVSMGLSRTGSKADLIQKYVFQNYYVFFEFLNFSSLYFTVCRTKCLIVTWLLHL